MNDGGAGSTASGFGASAQSQQQGFGAFSSSSGAPSTPFGGGTSSGFGGSALGGGGAAPSAGFGSSSSPADKPRSARRPPRQDTGEAEESSDHVCFELNELPINKYSAATAQATAATPPLEVGQLVVLTGLARGVMNGTVGEVLAALGGDRWEVRVDAAGPGRRRAAPQRERPVAQPRAQADRGRRAGAAPLHNQVGRAQRDDRPGPCDGRRDRPAHRPPPRGS
ncbi:hypothetical protein THAOC_34150, partial [Thalassiosira oceanica]